MYRRDIKGVTVHTHLGIKLQQNQKWTGHIKDVISRAKMCVDILRDLMYMYKLRSKSTKKLHVYVMYVRPILEYRAGLWDNCNDYEKDQVGKGQQMGIRAITGTKRETGYGRFCFDTVLDRLSERRKRQKLTLFYKIKNQMAPIILWELIPETTAERTTYTLMSHHF